MSIFKKRKQFSVMFFPTRSWEKYIGMIEFIISAPDKEIALSKAKKRLSKATNLCTIQFEYVVEEI